MGELPMCLLSVGLILRTNQFKYPNYFFASINRAPLSLDLKYISPFSSSAFMASSCQRVFQHRNEAFWFYRFLSIIYDYLTYLCGGDYVRDASVVPADLCSRDLKVVDVGGGTGYTTLGIVKYVDAKNVTILDQSPHQLAQAKKKPQLRECTIIEGDAEYLPFPTDSADRYVSAGSIEYWPDPQRGIAEAYRVLKPGGLACMIGPVYPTYWLSRIMADVWMLFPKEEDYIQWFKNAGFEDIKLTRIGPKWYRGQRRHGLIIGTVVTGVKSVSGESPLKLGPKVEDVKRPTAPTNQLKTLVRFALGYTATFYFCFVVPIYMMIKDKIVPKGMPI